MKQEQNGDIFFMGKAIDEAGKALSVGEVPIGAVIVCNGVIIARGHNLVETLQDPTAHAEMQAITSATESVGGKYLKECTLYVTVEPCPMCAAACSWAQLGNIVYGASDPKGGYSRFGDSMFHPKTKIIKGVETEKCSELMTVFFKNMRQKI